MTAALIIAAGQTGGARRFEPEKEVGTLSALKRSVLTFQMAGVERIAVVCDGEEDRAEKLIPHMNVVFLHSSHTGEMLESIKTGLSYLQDKCSAVLISHTDVPLFSVETVKRLLEAEGEICVPVCGGRGGHPIRLSAGQIPGVLGYDGPDGLAGAIRAAGVEKTRLEVDDEGILANVRDGRKYEHLISGYEKQGLRPGFRFQLLGDRPFYGPGAHQLLHLTEETGSLMDACRLMGISYSKGRKIIANLERHMDCPVLERTRGGKSGGASTVTEAGKALMETYGAFCQEAEEYLTQLFSKYF